MSCTMETWEWRRMFASLPDATPEEMAAFLARRECERRREEEESGETTADENVYDERI